MNFFEEKQNNTDQQIETISSGQNGEAGEKPDYGFMCLVMAARALGLPGDYNQLILPADYTRCRMTNGDIYSRLHKRLL